MVELKKSSIRFMLARVCRPCNHEPWTRESVLSGFIKAREVVDSGCVDYEGGCRWMATQDNTKHTHNLQDIVLHYK